MNKKELLLNEKAKFVKLGRRLEGAALKYDKEANWKRYKETLERADEVARQIRRLNVELLAEMED